MADLKISLFPGQSAIYNSPARFKIVAAGRRFGKSYFACRTLGLAALQTHSRNGKIVARDAGIYYVAPTFDQARRIMWPKLQEFLGYASRDGLIARENANDGFFELINGRRIYIKGADNQESLRGEGYLYVVLDEYADMKPNIVKEILRPALMDYEGDMLFIGTPKGKNHFYKLFMKALEYKYDPERDPYPIYEAFHFKSADNPTITRRELDMLMDDEGRSSDAVRQELEASFVSGGSTVLKPEWFKIISDLPTSITAGSVYVTVDLAGFKKQQGSRKILRTDESVIAITLVVPEGWFVLDMQHGHWDTRKTAYNIVKAVRDYPGCRLGIEQGALANAVGPYIEDYMREFGRFVAIEPLRHGNTSKTDRIVWALQGRAERGRIYLLKGPWNQWFLEQVGDFPDPLSRDDGPDALAYVDQISTVNYQDADDEYEWEPLDMVSGY